MYPKPHIAWRDVFVRGEKRDWDFQEVTGDGNMFIRGDVDYTA